MNSLSSKQSEWLNKLLYQINQRISKSNFVVEDLIKPMMTSRTQLYNRVKTLTGFTPNQYIQQIRLEKAQQILYANTYNSLSQIINEVGFKSLNRFEILYKQSFGESPTLIFERLWGQRLKSLILQKLTQSNYSVEDLVFDMGVDKKTLYERTKRITGTSPGRYIRHLKLEKVKTLIESGNINSIKEAAQNVGFQRVDYFSNLYKEQYNYHPKEYLDNNY